MLEKYTLLLSSAKWIAHFLKSILPLNFPFELSWGTSHAWHEIGPAWLYTVQRGICDKISIFALILPFFAAILDFRLNILAFIALYFSSLHSPLSMLIGTLAANVHKYAQRYARAHTPLPPHEVTWCPSVLRKEVHPLFQDQSYYVLWKRNLLR